ncbi:hypothetical protein LEP1GSC192_0318 [Leptospira sp. B5-022]|nr:hypothetical protein LEP1GSC192_0318 [Leptospira sp. B5-022]
MARNPSLTAPSFRERKLLVSRNFPDHSSLFFAKAPNRNSILYFALYSTNTFGGQPGNQLWNCIKSLAKRKI